MVDGITTANLGTPDYSKAIEQHQNYIVALKKCGLNVTVLEADENFPDSTFVEDTALITPHCVIITNPGAESRQQEIQSMKITLSDFFDHIETINSPGTVEAGDIMMVGNHYYIGLSARTNLSGANQMTEILKKYGMTASTIPLKEVLHLKTGLSYLENNNLLVCGEFQSISEFQQYNQLRVEADEAYAANSVWINGHVLIPAGFPKARQLVESCNYQVIEVDVSEFQKIDGGLSCLSLRF